MKKLSSKASKYLIATLLLLVSIFLLYNQGTSEVVSRDSEKTNLSSNIAERFDESNLMVDSVQASKQKSKKKCRMKRKGNAHNNPSPNDAKLDSIKAEKNKQKQLK
jgi:hypothetical protein